jgi:hypothetical protein
METAAFEQGADISAKRLKKMAGEFDAIGKSMTSLGTKLSVGLTLPFVAFGKASVEAALGSRDAMGQVEQAIASMGNAAGRSAEQLAKLASNEMHNSLYDDDDILRKVTANLLTFGNVSGTVFDQAQQLAVDLSARLGQDLQSSAIQLGKALNDPVKGIAALQRVGVSFTAQQKEQIKAMVAVGDTAGAQKLIIAELTKEFGGAAAAAAKANPFAALKHSLDDFQEAVGGVLLKILPPATNAINAFVSAFNELPSAAQEFAVGGALAAAALGPILTGLGALVSASSTVLAALTSISASMASVGTIGGALEVAVAAAGGALAALAPIAVPLAAIAAAGALIYANWDKIAPVLQDLWQTAQTTLGPPLEALVSALSDAFSALWSGPLGSAIAAAASAITSFQSTLIAAFGATVVAAIKVTAQFLGQVFQQIADGVRLITALFQGDWSKAFQLAGQIVNRAFAGLPTYVIQQVGALVSGVRSWIVDKLGAVWDGAVERIERVKRAFFNLYDAVVGHSYVPDMVDGIAAEMARLDTVMVKPATAAAKKAGDAMSDLAAKTRAVLDELFPDTSERLANRGKWDLIDQADAAGTQGGGLSAASAQEARNRLLQPSVDAVGASLTAIMQQQLPDLSANAGDVADRAKEKLQNWQTVIQNIGQSFGGAAAQIANGIADVINPSLDTAIDKFQQMQQVVGGLTSLFQTIFGRKAGALIGAVVNLGLTIAKPRGFATGTNYAPGGLSWVGERGPELVNLPRSSQVISNSRLRGLGSQQTVNNYYTLPSDEFWSRVDGRAAGVVSHAAPALVRAGGRAGMARMQKAQSRQLA